MKRGEEEYECGKGNEGIAGVGGKDEKLTVEGMRRPGLWRE